MGARQDTFWIFNFLYFWIVLFLVWPSLVGASEVPVPEMDPQGFPAMGTGCLATGKCHAGIEPIRAHNSGMAKQIYRKGKILGDPNGCVVCHGGDPKEEKKPALAHKGAPKGGRLEVFTRHPASMWVNDKTCGQCHEEWVQVVDRTLLRKSRLDQSGHRCSARDKGWGHG